MEIQRVGGRYSVGALLGRGSMGAVYRARHDLTAGEVALKLIHPAATQTEIAALRFRREVSVSARVTHDGIVKVFDAGQEPDGTLYLAMELLNGETLQERSERPGFTPAYGLDVVRALLEPLGAAHAADIVHRDIKPENVFLHRRPDGREQVKLLDFGIARDPRSQSGTRADVGLGTPFYMSPEQATNARDVTPASDVWAVGVLLYWLLEGRLPFEGETPFVTLTKVCTEPLRPLEVTGGEKTEALAALVTRCLDKDPGARPDDASALLVALNEIIGPSPIADRSAASYGSNAHLGTPWAAPTPAAQSSGAIVMPPPPAAVPAGPIEGATEAAFATGAVAAPPARRRRWLPAALVLLILTAGVALALRPMSEPEAPAVEPPPAAAAAPAPAAVVETPKPEPEPEPEPRPRPRRSRRRTARPRPPTPEAAQAPAPPPKVAETEATDLASEPAPSPPKERPPADAGLPERPEPEPRAAEPQPEEPSATPEPIEEAEAPPAPPPATEKTKEEQPFLTF